MASLFQKKYLLIFVFVVNLISGCKFGKKSDETSQAKFLNEHSRRRLASVEESAGIFRLKTFGGNQCTAFAVKNDTKKPIVFTARHCMNYEASQWCEKVGELKTADELDSYRCKQVLFDPPDSDFAALELDKPISDDGYLLADFEPRDDRRLQMIGYPADWHGKSLGGTVITENCWLTSINRVPVNVVTKINPNPVAALHNCATYGGNSGGPMILENSKIVVGMPGSYWKSERLRSMDETAFIYLTYDVIKTHRTFVENEKLALAKKDDVAEVKQRFISRSRCTSEGSKKIIRELVPLYNSADDFTALKVKFNDADFVLFRCKEDNSCEDRTNNSGDTIKIKSASQVTYISKNVSADFACENF